MVQGRTRKCCKGVRRCCGLSGGAGTEAWLEGISRPHGEQMRHSRTRCSTCFEYWAPCSHSQQSHSHYTKGPRAQGADPRKVLRFAPVSIHDTMANEGPRALLCSKSCAQNLVDATKTRGKLHSFRKLRKTTNAICTCA